MSQSMDSNDPVDPLDNDSSPVRKRVGKACDRCRNKKSKCNGLQQCQRCSLDNTICQYTERDKTQEKVWPKGTVETLQDSMDIMQNCTSTMYKVLKENDLLPAAKIESFNGDTPSFHDIALALDCMPKDKTVPPICNEHETVAGGILRIRSQLKDCQTCPKNQVEEEMDIGSQANKAWNQPEYGLPKQPHEPAGRPSTLGFPHITTSPNLSAFPPQTTSSSPLLMPKQEEPSLQMQQQGFTEMNQRGGHLMPHQLQRRRSQPGRRPRNLNTMATQGYVRNAFPTDNLPTPTYSPESLFNDQVFLNHPNPNFPFACPTSTVGPQCFSDCAPSSMVPCNDDFDPQQLMSQMGEPEPPVAPFVNPQLLQPNFMINNLWGTPFDYPHPNH